VEFGEELRFSDTFSRVFLLEGEDSRLMEVKIFRGS
jgi:hypothetical protein